MVGGDEYGALFGRDNFYVDECVVFLVGEVVNQEVPGWVEAFAFDGVGGYGVAYVDIWVAEEGFQDAVDLVAVVSDFISEPSCPP